MMDLIKIVMNIEIGTLLAVAVIIIPLCFAATVYYLRK